MDGSPCLLVGDDQHQTLVSVLNRVRAEHRARVAFLAETCGRPVAVSGRCEDLEALASLLASVYAAAAHAAGLLGESGLTLAMQRGENDVIHLAGAGQFVLAVLFTADAPHGLERLRARLRQRRAVAEIAALFQQVGPERPDVEVAEGELEALLAGLGPAAEGS